MKSATTRLDGRAYTSRGGPYCMSRPSCMTAMRSESAIASDWSCVT
jgi:hypothetical protein